MVNLFEDEEGVHLVLVNGEEQCSLWPTFRAVPAGWSVAHDAGARANCPEHVSGHWSDMRPANARELTGVVREVVR
ncbi:MbtH family protein [Micromonospora chersina]|uniref:MbtH family protein n=1 Tax=Micromonospora chersina TaxID=47854 RepID=UPI003711A298